MASLMSKRDSDSSSLASSSSLLRESKQSNADSSASKSKRPSFLSRHLLSSSSGDKNSNSQSNSQSSRQSYPVSADPISMIYQKYPGLAASPR